jgi:hypothetical protein
MGAEALQFLLLWMAAGSTAASSRSFYYLKEENRVVREQLGGRRLRFIERRERLGGLLHFYFRHAA